MLMIVCDGRYLESLILETEVRTVAWKRVNCVNCVSSGLGELGESKTNSREVFRDEGLVMERWKADGIMAILDTDLFQRRERQGEGEAQVRLL